MDSSELSAPHWQGSYLLVIVNMLYYVAKRPEAVHPQNEHPDLTTPSSSGACRSVFIQWRRAKQLINLSSFRRSPGIYLSEGAGDAADFFARSAVHYRGVLSPAKCAYLRRSAGARSGARFRYEGLPALAILLAWTAHMFLSQKGRDGVVSFIRLSTSTTDQLSLQVPSIASELRHAFCSSGDCSRRDFRRRPDHRRWPCRRDGRQRVGASRSQCSHYRHEVSI